MTPEADTAGLTPSAAPGADDDVSKAKARSAAAQAWVKQLDMGFSLGGTVIQRNGASAGAGTAWVCRVSRAVSAAPSASARPIPATEAGQPIRSKTWPSTALPARP